MKFVKTKLMIACLLMLAGQVSGQEKYSQVKIFVPKDRAQRSALLGKLQIDHFEVSQDGAIVTEIGDKELAKLKATPYSYQVLIDDVKANLEVANRKYFTAVKKGGRQTRLAMEQSGSTVGSIITTPAAFEVKSTYGGYYSFAEMETAMNTLVATYPAIASKTSIGKTAENRDIWVIKISDAVATDDTGEPEILYMGLQHAREAITGSSMIFFMQYLCENYATDTRIKSLVDNREIYIIPCFNPDGWEYNRTNGGAGSGWRKNRSKVDSSKQGHTWNYTYGVDLNRNWGIDWGNCPGLITDPNNACGTSVATEETYIGDAAFSELETQAVRAFAKTHHLVAGFDQHAYGPYYSLPFGRKGLHTMPQKGLDFYTTVPALMGTYNGMRAADSYDALGYEVAGGFKDWMLMGEIGVGTKDTVWAMTGEGAAGGGSGGTYSNFWAPASQIVNLSKGMCYQNLQLAFAAGSYVDVQDVNDIAIGATSGTLSFFIKRLGLGNDPVTVTLVPIENIQSVGSAVTVSSMPIYYDTAKRSVTYTLSSGVVAGSRIRYAWQVQTGGSTFRDTITRFYNPTVLFSDDMEGTLSSNWVATSNVTDNWAYTTTAAYSGTKSLTESPAGDYSSSTTRTIVYKNAIDISVSTAAYLSFWVKHRAENFRDKLQVQVSTTSTNGTDGTWTAIPGTTTIQEGGTLDGATLNGQASLTGIRDYWTQELFDVSAYKNSNFRFRFQFTSDGDPSSFKFEKDDGFYIDDIKLVKSTAAMTVLANASVLLHAQLRPDGLVQLNWANHNDEPTAYFDIEYSANGTSFQLLERMAASAPYSFIHAQPADGNNYYRIKAVGENGKTVYSKMERIVASSHFKITVLPNPVQTNLQLLLRTESSEVLGFQFWDASGRLVLSKTQMVSEGNSTLSFDVANWSAQVYLLKVVNARGEAIATEKIFKR